MKALDRWLQSARISKARPYIRSGSRVLDIGCADGVLFKQLGSLVGEGIGLDPELPRHIETHNYSLLPGNFPETLEGELPFDAITLLAVLEHVPPESQKTLAKGCARYLKEDGYLIVTTPSPLVDHILDVLATLRIIDGMSLDEHYGFEPSETPAIFESHGLALVEAKKFQLGLNNLFVFQKC